MKGGSLTRFRPDDQSGRSLANEFKSLVKTTALGGLKGGWKGLKTGGPLGSLTFQAVFVEQRKGPRGTRNEPLWTSSIEQPRENSTISLENESHLFETSKRIPILRPGPSRVYKGGIFLPGRSNRVDYRWLQNALRQTRSKRKRRRRR